MTTIAFTPASGAHCAAPTTRLRMTRRGRRVLVAAASAPAVVALAIVTVFGGSALASADSTPPAPASFETMTVMPGDTLWSIAQSLAPSADPRDVVDAIIRLNALGSTALAAGESIAIPAEYDSAK